MNENNTVPSERKEEDSAGDSCSIIVIGLLFLLACLISMIVTGGLVYGAYGWEGEGSGPNGTFFTRMAGMFMHAKQKWIDDDQNPFNKSSHLSCPQFGTCPPVVGCIGTGCRWPPAPACIPNPTVTPTGCPEDVTCPPGSCAKPYLDCPTTRPPAPSIDYFRSSPHDLIPIWKWLSLYPPYSPERLEVVTTLMEEYLEPWVTYAFQIKCPADGDLSWEMDMNKPGMNTHCTFCTDRYEYVKCVMSHNIVPHPNKLDNLPLNFPEPRLLGSVESTITEVMKQRWKIPPLHFFWKAMDSVHNNLMKAISVFNVTTFPRRDGEVPTQCVVCRDYIQAGPKVFDRCQSDPSNKYYTPAERDAQ